MARVIRQSARHSKTESRALLQALLTAELVAPSKILWVVSPWISDIPVLDNRGGTFQLVEAWGAGDIPLSKVLVAVALRGGFVRIITTTDAKNEHFLCRLADEAQRADVTDRIVVVYNDDEMLHEKAVVGDDFVIDGSMNLTYYGLQFRQERINYDIDIQRVAAARMEMRQDFGGGSV